jgi:hypothetical protein
LFARLSKSFTTEESREGKTVPGTQKIVEWFEEDQCFVGSPPGIIYGGCHGDDEKLVFEELRRIVEEAIELY